MAKPKPWYKSKTKVAAVLFFLGAVGTGLTTGSWNEAVQAFVVALGLFGVRDALN